MRKGWVRRGEVEPFMQCFEVFSTIGNLLALASTQYDAIEVWLSSLNSRRGDFCFLTISIYLIVWIISCSVRSLVALNLNNYGSGRHPWGNLSPEYMEKVYSSFFFLFLIFFFFTIRFYYLAQFPLDSKQDIISVYCIGPFYCDSCPEE